MPVHSTTVDGITMRWEEDGVAGADGQVPVVFLHGIPTSPRLWRHVMPLVGGDDWRGRWSATASRSLRAVAVTSP